MTSTNAPATPPKCLHSAEVRLQEELDWTCLHLYGLTDEALVVPDGHDAPSLRLGERAFEIVLARKVAAGELETAWFTRHRSTPITGLPSHWPDWYRDLVKRRIALIEADRDVGLVERPEHKRRWARTEWDVLEEKAQRGWLLDRLEDRGLWFDGGRAVTRTVRQLADRMASDEAWMLVAREWAGSAEADPTEVVSKLVADEHVPAQAAARYTAPGLAKRAEWERVWDLQRAEDRGEDVAKIPVPPKYAQKDFAKASFWRQRGKLDVPKERFTSVPGAERDGTPVLAWAGFDHAELAQALATALLQRQTTEGWQGEQLIPLLVALSEVIPWVAQWHPDVDPSVGQPLAVLRRPHRPNPRQHRRHPGDSHRLAPTGAHSWSPQEGLTEHMGGAASGGGRSSAWQRYGGVVRRSTASAVFDSGRSPVAKDSPRGRRALIADRLGMSIDDLTRLQRVLDRAAQGSSGSKSARRAFVAERLGVEPDALVELRQVLAGQDVGSFARSRATAAIVLPSRLTRKKARRTTAPAAADRQPVPGQLRRFTCMGCDRTFSTGVAHPSCPRCQGDDEVIPVCWGCGALATNWSQGRCERCATDPWDPRYGTALARNDAAGWKNHGRHSRGT